MNVVEAYKFLEGCLFFARPIYDENGNIEWFEDGFKDAVEIFPVKKDKWYVEFGSFSLDSGVYWLFYDEVFSAKSYEKAIIKLAKKVKEYDDTALWSYFDVPETPFEENFIRTDKGYSVIRENCHFGCWRADEVIERIRAIEMKSEGTGMAEEVKNDE